MLNLIGLFINLSLMDFPRTSHLLPPTDHGFLHNLNGTLVYSMSAVRWIPTFDRLAEEHSRYRRKRKISQIIKAKQVRNRHSNLISVILNSAVPLMASSSVPISHNYLRKTSKTLPPFPLSVTNFATFAVTAVRFRSVSCSSAKQPRSGSVKSNQKRRKKKGGSSSSSSPAPKGFGGLEVLEDRENGGYEEEEEDGESGGRSSRSQQGYVPPPLPKPPAGFVVDGQGRVLMASSKRIVTVVDPTNNLPLECTIRRIFTSSKGAECMLLCPVDMPVEIVKSTSNGWASVSDEEIEAILPTADYSLARIHMHLVHSGFCFTARGGFCYSEDSIMEFVSEGETMEGISTEGVEITCFHMDGSHYMMYTPSDPLLFVAVKDESGKLQIIDDELLDDPNIISAIDEETEFNAFVEEEIALLESLLGERDDFMG